MSNEERSWISWFCRLRGNEMFCPVDLEYIKDKFNLTGLSDHVPHYRQALALILDEDTTTQPARGRRPAEVDDCDNDELIEQAAELLYGLIHARFVLTSRGTSMVLGKFKDGAYGHCPRVYCGNQAMLPIGLSDVPGEAMVKLYCPKCTEVYTPKQARYLNTDGAYFGTGLPTMVFMDNPASRPKISETRHVATLYGFKIHPLAYQTQHQKAPKIGGDS